LVRGAPGARPRRGEGLWAAPAAVKDQEAAGIDVVSDGELFRRDDNRFGPPNAMINYFASRIPGFAPGLRDRTAVTPVAPDAVLPAPVIDSELGAVDLGLTRELSFLRETTLLPVKIALTGPHMFACVAWDEHYGGARDNVGYAMADVIGDELRRLDAAGCDVVQLDEPILWFLRDDQSWAVECINRAFDGVATARRALHLCQGNYNPDPGAHCGIRIFPAEFESVLPILAAVEVDVVLLAFASLGVTDLGVLGEFPRDKAYGIGVVDVQSHEVETPDEVARTIERVADALGGPTVVATPDCGLNHLPREIAFGKLRSLAAGAELVRGAPVAAAAAR
jgi:5-methyltetrahydropteroyltriglutamate--homocysteine methyltransferase